MKNESIKVACRIRPLNHLEEKTMDVIKIDNNSISMVSSDENKNTSFRENTFNFDKIFSQASTQEEVFEYIAKPTINSVFKGYNGTILCYGQTSSGKTYTIEGDYLDGNNKGLIPRSISLLFNHIEKASNKIEFSIKCSFLEIYNEKLYDLLDSK